MDKVLSSVRMKENGVVADTIYYRLNRESTWRKMGSFHKIYLPGKRFLRLSVPTDPDPSNWNCPQTFATVIELILLILDFSSSDRPSGGPSATRRALSDRSNGTADRRGSTQIKVEVSEGSLLPITTLDNQPFLAPKPYLKICVYPRSSAVLSLFTRVQSVALPFFGGDRQPLPFGGDRRPLRV